MAGEFIAIQRLLRTDAGLVYGKARPDNTAKDIDLIAVAQTGVYVLDVKNWSSPIRLSKDGRLWRSKYRQDAAITGLAEQVEIVRHHLGGKAPVYGALVLVDNPSVALCDGMRLQLPTAPNMASNRLFIFSIAMASRWLQYPGSHGAEQQRWLDRLQALPERNITPKLCGRPLTGCCTASGCAATVGQPGHLLCGAHFKGLSSAESKIIKQAASIAQRQ